MRRKYRDLKRKGNVIVFPTTVDRLLNEGMNLLKDEKYELASDKLYQVLTYEPEHAGALGAYSYCLFELGEYEEALDVCKELLKVGPVHYLETMELYISILMQVKEFEEAERMIEVLIEEKVLPEERLEQFQQLRELNERIVSNKAAVKIDPTLYTASRFIALPPADQERLIMELPPASYEVMKGSLMTLVEHPETDMLTKTYILFMLHQEQVDAKVHLTKFEFAGEFKITDLPDPQNDKRVLNIKAAFEEALDQDPTRLEMVRELFERHVFLIYPFMWEKYSEQEVAEAYISFVDSLFSGNLHLPGGKELLEIIKQAERCFELRDR